MIVGIFSTQHYGWAKYQLPMFPQIFSVVVTSRNQNSHLYQLFFSVECFSIWIIFLLIGKWNSLRFMYKNLFYIFFYQYQQQISIFLDVLYSKYKFISIKCWFVQIHQNWQNSSKNVNKHRRRRMLRHDYVSWIFMQNCCKLTAV